MGNWIRYFIGTPQRFARTAIAVGLVVVIMQPGLLASATQRLVAELMPLLGPALAILIVFGGLKMIIFGRK